MKPLFFIISLLLISPAFAQNKPGPALNKRLGIKAGINLAILSQAINADMDFKSGLMGGLYYQGIVKNNVSIQPELLISSQGCRFTYLDQSDQVQGEVNLNLIYMNMPLLLKVYAGRSLNFQFGPQVALLVGAREKGWETKYTYNPNTLGQWSGERVDVDENVKLFFQDHDLAFCLGFGYDLPAGLNLGIRLNLGMSDIYFDKSFKALTGYKTVNRLFQFSLGYSFRRKTKNAEPSLEK